MHRALVSLTLIAFLAGCAVLGLPTPQTFNEKVAAGYTAVTAVRVTAADLLDAEAIAVSDAVNVQKQADVAREGLDVAREIRAANPDGAERRVDAVLTVLRALQTYLDGKKEDSR